ncbi:MAG TPA: hypothetical protein VHX37_15820 [Acidobacteriaceae bacterium]|jgi:hypothetical protein|nr:hypothetical protein [Acidobacteriaceae bacterium]
MQKRDSQTKRQEPTNHPGGREFGNVIEPMQAEMASENRGLADDSGSPQKPQRRNLSWKKSGKKAA